MSKADTKKYDLATSALNETYRGNTWEAAFRQSALVYQRTALAFIAVGILVFLSAWLIKTGLHFQSTMLEVSSITFKQRILIDEASDRILYLLRNAQNREVTEELINEIKADIRGSVDGLNDNQKILEDIFLNQKQSFIDRLFFRFGDDDAPKLVEDMHQQFAGFNERMQLFFDADALTLKAGFNFWTPLDLAIFRSGKHNNQISDLNKVIYNSAISQNKRISTFYQILLGVVLLGMLIIWWLILKPLSHQIKAQYKQIQRSHRALMYQANHDSLTGLLNRESYNSMIDRLAEDDLKPQNLAVFIIDIDKFKSINDAYGHAAGDTVIKAVASRISDGQLQDEHQFRLGGDEFAILFFNMKNRLALAERAMLLSRNLREPIQVGQQRVEITASIGVEFQQARDLTVSDLMTAADIALFHAKRDGGNHYLFFDQTGEAGLNEVNEMEKELRRAVDNDEFKAFYQPVVRLSDNKVVSFEALARWHHPARGVLSPGTWLATADRTFLTTAITERIIDLVIRDHMSWINKGYTPLPININATEGLLLSQKLIQTIEKAIELDPDAKNWIGIEIPESIILDSNFDLISEQLRLLQKMGVKIYLDDFGTGYAALSHLLEIPFDVLKIDKVFVDNITVSEHDRVVLKSMIELTKGMNKDLICEGVESTEVKDLIQYMGCDYIQGYLYSCAVDFREASQMIQNRVIELPKA